LSRKRRDVFHAKENPSLTTRRRLNAGKTYCARRESLLPELIPQAHGRCLNGLAVRQKKMFIANGCSDKRQEEAPVWGDTEILNPARGDTTERTRARQPSCSGDEKGADYSSAPRILHRKEGGSKGDLSVKMIKARKSALTTKRTKNKTVTKGIPSLGHRTCQRVFGDVPVSIRALF